MIPTKESRVLLVVGALVASSTGVLAITTQAAYAYPIYGPSNASYAAYYANPSNQSTWSAFCSGAGDGASYTGVQALGVPACGPTPTNEEVGIDIGANGSGGPTPDFQCVEFAERYLDVIDGYAPINSTNGDQVVAHYASAHSLTVVANGTGQLPQVGAVMSFADNSSFNSSDGGHVAVVTAVTSTSVTVVGENQNGSGPYTDGSATMTVTGNDYINDFNPSMPSIEWFNAGASMTSLLLAQPKLQSDGLYLERVTVSGSGFGVEPANGEEAPNPPGYDYPNNELWFADVTQNWQFGNSVDGDGNPNAIGVTIKSYSGSMVVYTFLDGGSYPWEPPAKGNKIKVAVAGLVCHAKVAFGKDLNLTSCTTVGSN